MDKQISEMIRYARVLCITALVSYHFWGTAQIAELAKAGDGLAKVFHFVVSWLGISSVPLLGLVSGILFVTGIRKRLTAGADGVLKKQAQAKIRSLFVPYVLWNLFYYLFFLIGFLVIGGDSNVASLPPLDVLNGIFGVTAMPFNFPLHFVRDLLIAMLTSLGGLWVYSRLVTPKQTGSAPGASTAQGYALWVLPASIFVLLFVDIAFGIRIFHKETTAIFFLFGVTFSVFITQVNRKTLSAGALVFIAIGVTILIARATLGIADDSWIEDIGRRFLLTGSGVILSLAFVARQRGGVMERTVKFIEPHMFMIFCNHLFLIVIAGQVFDRLPELFPYAVQVNVLFAFQWLITIGGGLLLSIAGRRVFGSWWQLMDPNYSRRPVQSSLKNA